MSLTGAATDPRQRQRRSPSPTPPNKPPHARALAGRAQAVPQPTAAGATGGDAAAAWVDTLLQNPEAVQLALYAAVVAMGIYAFIRIVRAILLWSSLLGLGLAFLKPDVACFEEALKLMEKRQQDDPTPSASTTEQQQRGAGWLMNLIERTSALLQRNPVKEWVYIDLGVAILARKKEGARTFALGVAKHWILLAPARLGDWPWLPYLHHGAGTLSELVPEQYWRAFDPTPKSIRRLQQQHGGTAGEIVDDLLSAAAAATGSVLASASASASAASSPRAHHQHQHRGHSPPRSPRRHGGNHQQQHQSHQRGHSPSPPPARSPRGDERPIKEYMRRAQALAEKGRFVDAGAAVEEGIARCRTSLRSGGEEEMELWVVAAAFYEAAQTSPQATVSGGGGFMGRLRCLQRAGELAARQRRYARASELFNEAAESWYQEKAKGSPFGLVASGKAAPLVFASILSQLVFGDNVKAQQLFRMACAQDRSTAPGFPRTAEGVLAAAILEATRNHDAQALVEAHLKYRAKPEHKLDAWQAEALALLKERIEEGAQLR